MYCRTGDQLVPPHSTGQCGTAQPLALRMRCQPTKSSLARRRPSIILRRIDSGSTARRNVRTSSRKAFSSGVNRRSMAARDLKLVDFEQAGSAHAAADAHGDDGVLGAAATTFDQDMA